MDLTHGPVWGIWHGGSNYSRGGHDDVETFTSIEDAIIEAGNRLACGHYFPAEFVYTRKPVQRTLTPVVDESSTIEIYLADPGEDGDLIPDLVIDYDEENERFRIAEDYVHVLAYRTLTASDVNALAD